MTIRVRAGIRSLRTVPLVREIERSFRDARERDGFRLVHYTVQANHVHLLVEADGPTALSRGMKSIGARLARAVNRVFQRCGAVLADRYHARTMTTPREVRNAVAYVLLNARRHLGVRAPAKGRIDPASSGRWFEGWLERPDQRALDSPAVAQPRTWLLSVGWRRHGLLSPDEVPGLESISAEV